MQKKQSGNVERQLVDLCLTELRVRRSQYFTLLPMGIKRTQRTKKSEIKWKSEFCQRLLL